MYQWNRLKPSIQQMRCDEHDKVIVQNFIKFDHECWMNREKEIQQVERIRQLVRKEHESAKRRCKDDYGE